MTPSLGKIIPSTIRAGDGRYGVGEKMALAIDINSNTVRAIKGRLSDMEVSTARGTN